MDKAKWIWIHNENKANTWMCFVRDIECESISNEALAYIAADTKYWLYVNGEMVVFEGGLKRGMVYGAICFDEVNLGKYLVKGKNRLAVLVWHFGKHGFAHVSSGQGGFYFDAVIGNQHVCSDETWRVIKHPAYVAAPADDIGANYRLAESDVYFDAALDPGWWYHPDFCTDTWATPYVLTAEEENKMGKLIPRSIPLFKDFGIREFVNSQAAKNMHVQDDAVIEMRLPYNQQFTPILCLDAPAGKKITIKGQMYKIEAPGEFCLKSVYLTRDGYQEYEALGWLSGESITVEVPAGVTIHNLCYRETGYDTTQLGSFSCDDEFLNKLWGKAYRTLHICMRDNFMDCPDRERAQWWGDVNIQMQMALYSMDENAAALYEAGVNGLVSWFEATGTMLTVVPSGSTQFELPFQNLAGIDGFWTYYAYTGKRGFIEMVYPMARDYVLQYEIGDNQLVQHRTGSWDWPDWGRHADRVVMENAWYLLALKACRQMAELLGYSQDCQLYHARAEVVRSGMKSMVCPEGFYYHETDHHLPDERANALALLAGLVSEQQQDAVAAVLTQVENASPYMEKYVLDALCEMGRVDDAVKRIRKRYAAMVEEDHSTLWELWSKQASVHHGWTGGPLVTMSKYIAGISIAEPGGKTYRICPHLGTLNRVHCTMPTPHGLLTVDIERTPQCTTMTISAPQEISVQVHVPEQEKWNIIMTPQFHQANNPKMKAEATV